MLNVTILNSRSPTAAFVGAPLWLPANGSRAIQLEFSFRSVNSKQYPHCEYTHTQYYMLTFAYGHMLKCA